MAKKEIKREEIKNKQGKMVALPIDPINPKNKYLKVVINGNETKIERGKSQVVSDAVYERLVIAGYVIEG